MRRNGVVTRYGSKGFGFLLDLGAPQSRVEHSAEYFFHAVDVIGRVFLRAGDKVTFELGHPKPGAKAPVAIRIQLVASSDFAVRT